MHIVHLLQNPPTPDTARIGAGVTMARRMADAGRVSKPTSLPLAASFGIRPFRNNRFAVMPC